MCCCGTCCGTAASCGCTSTSRTGPACWQISPGRSAAGGNVIEVSHQRLFAAPSVQSAELELMIEVRDTAQGDAIVAALEAGLYVVRRG